MKIMRLMIFSLAGSLLISCAQKLIVLTENEITKYETDRLKLLDGVGVDGLGQLLEVYAVLNCEIGEVCPSDKYAILIQYWGKFTFMEGKKSKVISDGSQIRLRVEDSYYKQFANNEWF
jgi:hypothetical protein